MSNGLPSLKTPKYQVTIPSTGKKVKYRPFLVKEEKVLLMAKESKDPRDTMEAMKDILSACLLGTVKVEDLALFDIEYLFMKIRAKSVGEIIDLNLKCKNKVYEKDSGKHQECGTLIPISINLEKLKIKRTEGHTNIIPLQGNVGIVMKYPTIDIIDKLEKIDESDVMDIIISSIESIYDGDSVFNASELKRKDIEEFVDDMTTKQLKKVMTFFEETPHLHHEVKYKCPECGNSGTYTIRNLTHFFV